MGRGDGVAPGRWQPARGAGVGAEAKKLLGGYFIVEPDPKVAAGKLVATLKERRQGLGI